VVVGVVNKVVLVDQVVQVAVAAVTIQVLALVHQAKEMLAGMEAVILLAVAEVEKVLRGVHQLLEADKHLLLLGLQ
jgi:hypothetical protein